MAPRSPIITALSFLLLLILSPAIFSAGGHLSPSTSPEPEYSIENAIETALESVIVTQDRIVALASRAKRGHDKAALADCLHLYNSTSFRLNKTLLSLTSDTLDPEDIQTWLSGAMTNLLTCEEGMKELGVSNHSLPVASQIVSAQIADALALNNGTNGVGAPPSVEGGFPAWVGPRDRRLLQAPSLIPDAVVSLDGPGDYKTVEAAIEAVNKARDDGRRTVIHVKAGIYKHVEISKANVMLIGQGIGKTIFTGQLSVGGTKTTTFNSATFAVTADGFIARDITFRNTAGAQNHQAVAYRSESDRSVLYRCSIEGYQDSLYAHTYRQFYKDCEIYGTVDFIFGNAAAVFQGCNIFALESPGGTNTVTAQSRTDGNMNTGFSFIGCAVKAGTPQASTTFLGRPWKPFSRTVFLETYLGEVINPAGWLQWAPNVPVPQTVFYGEYKNTGPGWLPLRRVRWRQLHIITDERLALEYTVSKFLGRWLQATGIPFYPGL